MALANGSKIVSLPGANPDAIRGYSKPDLIIEDESAFVNDKTFSAVRPMLAASANPRHILMTTPYGRRGHFHELWRQAAPGWSRITIRSDECPRITADFLEGERNVLSEKAYRQEYQCEFLEAATAVFAADVIERLVDDGNRRHIMPDDEEVRQRRKEIEAVKTPDDLKKFQEKHGDDLSIERIRQDPGPWADL